LSEEKTIILVILKQAGKTMKVEEKMPGGLIIVSAMLPT